MVVALCASAVRDYLIERDDLPSDPLLAMIPVSVRTEAEQGEFGNRVGTMIVEIPTNEKDPRKRLDKTHASLMSAKARHQAVPASLLTDGTAFIPPAVAALAARSTIELLSRTRPPLNLVISNVPGPRDPLFCAGAQLEALYPVSAILDGVGLNMTVMSYRDHMDFGIIADRDQVDDTWGLLDRTREALDEFERVVVGRTKRARSKNGARRARRPAPTREAAQAVPCAGHRVPGAVRLARRRRLRRRHRLHRQSRDPQQHHPRQGRAQQRARRAATSPTPRSSGSDIKNGRLLGIDIEDESLTGKDIQERTLDKVPGAGFADAAALAGSAGSLGGVRVVPFELPLGRHRRHARQGQRGRAGGPRGCARRRHRPRAGQPLGREALVTFNDTNEVARPQRARQRGRLPADDGADSGQAGFVANSNGKTVRVH